MVFAERKDLGKWVLVSKPNGLKVFTGAVLISSRIALGGGRFVDYFFGFRLQLPSFQDPCLDPGILINFGFTEGRFQPDSRHPKGDSFLGLLL